VIAKRVPKEKGASNFARLARYVVDARGGLDPDTWKRTADYILDTCHDGEKVSGVRVSNCYSEDPAMATVEIRAKQALNRRSKTDRTYHLVVSFPPGEQPTLAQLHYIEDELCIAIGLANHQRISAVHTDTKHLHLHVAISKVHPVSLCCIEPYYDKQRLMQACERLEMELGLQRTNHGRLWDVRATSRGASRHGHKGAAANQGRGSTRPSGRAGDMEAHSARQSFLGWVQKRIRVPLAAASEWREFHRRLAEYGLHARLRGAGLVIGANGGGLYVQASKIDRGLSLHALTTRWGAFVAAGPECHHVTARERYDAQPTGSPHTGDLFARYQRARQASLAKRAEARERLRESHAQYATQLIEWYDKERQRLKDDKRLRGKVKLEALKQLSAKKKTDCRERGKLELKQRREVTAANPLLTWPQYLMDLARGGDERALAVIRHRASRSRAGESGNSLSVARGVDARHILLPTPDAQVDKNGDVVYRLQDGGLVVDGPASVRVLQDSHGAMALALVLAQERFADRRLVIEGTKTFGAKAAHIAGEQGLGVSFADERLERLRQAAGSGKARGQADIESYILARNKLHEQLTDVLEHRRWTAADAGTVLYRGRRRFQDGSEVVLLQRDRLMLVMPVTVAQAAKAAGWRSGSPIDVDSRGRFVGSSRGSRRS
jgi:MobA/VirD2-like, nuclease domain/TraI-like middle domain/TraI-like C-terminal domain/Large polyvalent protein-associated domain 7